MGVSTTNPRSAQRGERHAREDVHRQGARRHVELHHAGAFRSGADVALTLFAMSPA
jgi:glutamate synthase domain-containing protein 2